MDYTERISRLILNNDPCNRCKNRNDVYTYCTQCAWYYDNYFEEGEPEDGTEDGTED